MADASSTIPSAEEPTRPKRWAKRAMLTEDLPEWLVDRIAETEMDPKFAPLEEGL